MKDKFENLINEELNKYEFELPKDEYSVIASELAEKLVKLFCQPAVISSFCHHNGTYTTVTDSNGNEVCFKCRKPLAK